MKRLGLVRRLVAFLKNRVLSRFKKKAKKKLKWRVVLAVLERGFKFLRSNKGRTAVKRNSRSGGSSWTG